MRPPKPRPEKEARSPVPPVGPVKSRPIKTDELPKIELPDFPQPNTTLGEKKPGVPKFVWFMAAGLILLLVTPLAILGFLLSPRNPSAVEPIPVEIVSGMVPGEIAVKLEEARVIRSSFAFTAYTRLKGVQDELQAGNYQLSAARSTPDIIDELRGGPASDEIEVTFKPGETVEDNKHVLLALGYSENEVNRAFNATYDHPLLRHLPNGADLEGYIFGETHRFVKGTSAEDVLRRFFDDYYEVVKEHDLVNAYKKQGLSFHEGIILASIIQREVRSEADQKQVAQIFLDRLEIGMSLGADATFKYAAKKAGVTPDPSFDSPYNTRKYTGLPPGPIASPGLSALLAVAHPAEGDYLYFVSGDDGMNHFSHTNEEHEQKVRKYCTTECFGQ